MSPILGATKKARAVGAPINTPANSGIAEAFKSLSGFATQDAHTAVPTAAVIHPWYRFLRGRRTRTLRTAFFRSVRNCPFGSKTVIVSAVAEWKRPLIFLSPRGAWSL